MFFVLAAVLLLIPIYPQRLLIPLYPIPCQIRPPRNLATPLPESTSLFPTLGQREFQRRLRGCYNAAMTLVEITYELQSPLTQEQLGHLGEFANTYGLRRFRVDEANNQLSFEYDASRLRETQVAHALGQARIAVTRKVN
jgi:hypothetical protein